MALRNILSVGANDALVNFFCTSMPNRWMLDLHRLILSINQCYDTQEKIITYENKIQMINWDCCLIYGLFGLWWCNWISTFQL